MNRGEDPNINFLAMVKQHEQQGYQGKLRRFFRRMGGKDPISDAKLKKFENSNAPKDRIGISSIDKGKSDGEGDGITR